MPRPDASTHDPSAAGTKARVDATRLGAAECARRLGIGRSTLFRYMDEGGCPYPVQYALEQLRAAGKRAPKRRPNVDFAAATPEARKAWGRAAIAQYIGRGDKVT